MPFPFPPATDPTQRTVVGLCCPKEIKTDIQTVARATGLSVDGLLRLALVNHLRDTDLPGHEEVTQRILDDLTSRRVRMNHGKHQRNVFTPRTDG